MHGGDLLINIASI